MLYLIIPLAVLIGVIWAVVVFPSFRVVAAILVAFGAIVYFSASEKAAQEQKQQEAAKAQEEQQQRVTFEADQKAYCQAERRTNVPASQIEIREPSLTPGQFYGVINDDYSFTASARNKSKFKVTALRMNITALDGEYSGR